MSAFGGKADMLERGAMSAYDPKRTFWRRLTVRHRQADQNRSCGRLISDLSGRAMRTQGNTFPYVPHQLSIAKELVLLVRIELTPSPLPRQRAIRMMLLKVMLILLSSMLCPLVSPQFRATADCRSSAQARRR